jgi:hypothetical protein
MPRSLLLLQEYRYKYNTAARQIKYVVMYAFYMHNPKYLTNMLIWLQFFQVSATRASEGGISMTKLLTFDPFVLCLEFCLTCMYNPVQHNRTRLSS